MLTCKEAERLIARAADDPAALGDANQRELDEHTASCSSCFAALDGQRLVARMLHARPQVRVPAGFAGRLAARLDRESAGWLPQANWRAWTAALAPVAAALILAGWLGTDPAAGGRSGSTTGTVAEAPGTASATFEDWTVSAAASTPAAVFLESEAGGDALLEAVLTGSASVGESRDVR